jgi:hypothetical protein
MKQYKFTAVVTLDPAREGPTRQYPSVTHSIMVRCGSLRRPAVRRYFPALIWRADGEPLRPGDSSVIVTIAIADDEACEYFDSGQQVTLWNGRVCGHGTIARRVFFSWAI